MLASEMCVSLSNSSSSSIRGFSFRHGALAATLAVVIALAFLGFAPKAAANNSPADDVGAQAFKSNCVVCHGADGTGTPTGKSLKAPDLNSDAVQKMTDTQIADQISNGKNNMPPFKSALTKDQITALVAYVRATFGKKSKH